MPKERKSSCLFYSGFRLDLERVRACMRAHTYTSTCNWLTLIFILIVIILICSSEDANIILLAAENLGLNTGEFIFIILQQLEVGPVDHSMAPVVRGSKYGVLTMTRMHQLTEHSLQPYDIGTLASSS